MTPLSSLRVFIYLQPAAHCLHSVAELIPALSTVLRHFYEPRAHSTSEQADQSLTEFGQSVQLD